MEAVTKEVPMISDAEGGETVSGTMDVGESGVAATAGASEIDLTELDLSAGAEAAVGPGEGEVSEGVDAVAEATAEDEAAEEGHFRHIFRQQPRQYKKTHESQRQP